MLPIHLFNSYSMSSISILFRRLTSKHLIILAALMALGCLAVCYGLSRCFFKAKHVKDFQPQHEEIRSATKIFFNFESKIINFVDRATPLLLLELPKLKKNKEEENLPLLLLSNVSAIKFVAQATALPLPEIPRVEKTKKYENLTTLLLNDISEIKKEKLIELGNYVFDIDELVSHILGKNGGFIDPYNNRAYTLEEIKNILLFDEAQPILDLYQQIENQYRGIPQSAGRALKQLAKVLSADYNPKDEYASSKQALEVFAEYFSSLNAEEQHALENCVIIYKETSNRSYKEVRSTFKDVYNSFATGSFCNHQAAVYFWVLGSKIDPTFEPLPNKIQQTSDYWGGLFVKEAEQASTKEEKIERILQHFAT